MKKKFEASLAIKKPISGAAINNILKIPRIRSPYLNQTPAKSNKRKIGRFEKEKPRAETQK